MATHVTREAELFVILVDLLGDKKMERNALRVLVGTRGFELGRPYLHLCQQGMIEEEAVRPSFWRRLFGAQETTWVRVTEQGLKVAAQALAEEDTPALAEQAPTAEPSALPPIEAPVLDEPPKQDAVADTVIEEASAPATVSAATADDLPTVPPQPTVEPTPPQPPVPPAQAASRAHAPLPRRFAPTDFTETLGGVPFESEGQAVGSDRLDDLAENLGLLGFEITEAGKLLAINRWAQGVSDPEVALEITTTALAHAVRLSASGTATIDHDLALSLAGRVQESFAIFVSEGLMNSETVAQWGERMTSFLKEPVSTSGVEAYLLDPWRGIAPPAVCPDEIYLQTETETDAD